MVATPLNCDVPRGTMSEPSVKQTGLRHMDRPWRPFIPRSPKNLCLKFRRELQYRTPLRCSGQCSGRRSFGVQPRRALLVGGGLDLALLLTDQLPSTGLLDLQLRHLGLWLLRGGQGRLDPAIIVQFGGLLAIAVEVRNTECRALARRARAPRAQLPLPTDLEWCGREETNFLHPSY
jgi:hypothetical protein